MATSKVRVVFQDDDGFPVAASPWFDAPREVVFRDRPRFMFESWSEPAKCPDDPWDNTAPDAPYKPCYDISQAMDDGRQP